MPWQLLVSSSLCQYTLAPSHQSLLYSGCRKTTINNPRPLISGSQRGHHPSLQSPLCTSSAQLRHLTYLCFLQFLFPQQLSTETNRLRVAMVLMWCCWGRAEVIEELLTQCGRHVMSHHVFFSKSLSHMCFVSICHIITLMSPLFVFPLFFSQDMPSSFCLC